MSYTDGLLLLGIPTIVWLAVRAVRRMQQIKQRIAEVQDDLARNPQSPYAAMAELYNPPPPKSKERTRGKDHDD